MLVRDMHKTKQNKFEAYLAFFLVFDPGALPDIGRTAMSEIEVILRSDVSSEVE